MEELQSIAEEAVELGLVETAEVFLKVSAEEMIPVKRAAFDLIQTAINIIGKENFLEDPTKKNLDTPSKVFNFTRKMLASKEQDYREIMAKTIKFTKEANALLNQQIKLIFVYNDSNNQPVVFSVEELDKDGNYILPVGKISSKKGGSYTGKMRFRKSVLEKIMKPESTNSTNKNIQIPNNIKLADGFGENTEEVGVIKETYTNAYTRFQDTKKILKDTKNEKWYNASLGYVYWDVPGEKEDRGAAQLQSAGSLGEAYIAFYLNRLNQSNIPKRLEKGAYESNIKNFILDENYGALTADKTSGFLQGDVNEYQVKMLGASMSGFVEILKYAQVILGESNPETYLKDLQKTLREKGAAQKLGKVIEEDLDDFFNEVVDRIPQKKLTK